MSMLVDTTTNRVHIIPNVDMSDFKCECIRCIELREFWRIISLLPEADRKWMETFYEDLDNARLDADVNQAIIDGSWHTADEIIRQRRER